MCIIIYHDGGDTVPEKHFDNSILNHPDGFGMTYMNKKGRIIIYKNIDGNKMKKKYYDLVVANPESPFILHFRNATHGTPSEKNCHPFRIDKNHVFAHNGTVHMCTPTKENPGDYSDTRIFNEDILQHLPNGWFGNQAIEELLEGYVGKSKLAIMNRQGKVWLINGHQGIYVGTIWYSNDSYKFNPILHKQKEFESKYRKHDSDIITNTQEWVQDGLRMRWDFTSDTTEAFNPDMKRWNVYDLINGQFLKAPFTCKGHTPTHGRFTEKGKQENILQLVRVKKCCMCEEKHQGVDLKDYESGGTIFTNTCDDCYKFLLTIDPYTIEYRVVH